MTPLDDSTVRNIVIAVWDELADRGMDIQELCDNSDYALMRDIFDGLSDAVRTVRKGAAAPELLPSPIEE